VHVTVRPPAAWALASGAVGGRKKGFRLRVGGAQAMRAIRLLGSSGRESEVVIGEGRKAMDVVPWLVIGGGGKEKTPGNGLHVPSLKASPSCPGD
jgi:hypothetical protein